MNLIPFNKPWLTGKETEYMLQAAATGKISGDGLFTKKCHDWLAGKYGFKKVLLTTSCTDALEMAALLLNIKPGDEVIAPSFTFVSTVNPFVLRGAKIVFADSTAASPHLDIEHVESLITPGTKAIVPVHYGGVACDMKMLTAIASKHRLVIVEDAAQAIDSYYDDTPLGTFGDLSAFSFHETKNIMSGEGGMIVLNKEEYFERAEIVREKGTNRTAFFRGEVLKYDWKDVGSSFLPSDLIAAFLFAQLEQISLIQEKRKRIWNFYFDALKDLELQGRIRLPNIPVYAKHNHHLFYLLCADSAERTRLIDHLHKQKVLAVFHYQSLHKSHYYKPLHDGSTLHYADYYSGCLLRLPLFFELTESDAGYISESIHSFFRKH
jgi:dTDP-4-amino-4,6-dideoxygalactose transaminase